MSSSLDAFAKVWRDSLNQRHARVKQSRWLPVGIVLVGLAAGTGLYTWLDANRAMADQARLRAGVSRTEAWLSHTLEGYEDALRASAAYLSARGGMDSQKWHSYVERIQTLDHYPIDSSLFLVRPVDDPDVPAFEKYCRDNGFPKFQLHPPLDGQNEHPYRHYVIVAVEPATHLVGVVGTDQAAESRRRAAIFTARDKGIPVLTPPLVIRRGVRVVDGLVLMEPVY